MSKIICIGEILIDLTQGDYTESGVPRYAANPGGAPANVAVAASRLGADTAFIGCVGGDAFGRYLRDTLVNQNVDTTCLFTTESAPTTLAVVSVDGTGERSFQFYRSPGADLCLCEDMVERADIVSADVLHFGSVSLTADPSRTATIAAAKKAKNIGVTVTYDPNYREALWSDRDTAVEAMRAPLHLVDIIKISDEETELITGEADPERAAAILENKGIPLVLVTLGADGVLYRFRGNTGTVPGFKVKVADTNGAGDTFFGAVLSELAGRDISEITETELCEVLRMANCAAAITTSRPGAIPAMPDRNEVLAYLA